MNVSKCVVTCYEQVHEDKLKLILCHQDYFAKQMKPESFDKFSFSQLEKYQSKIKNHQIKVEYKQYNERGRLWAINGQSLQSFPKIIRGTLARGLYYDIDMVNAHPSILQFICKKLKQPCPNLSLYIKQRDKLIAKIQKFNPEQSYDSIKKAILGILNGGVTMYENLNKTEWLNDFKSEIEHIHNKFAAHFPKYYDEIKVHRIAEGKDYNHKASLMNHILCNYENQYLDCMIEYLQKHKIIKNDFVCCFDGVMIPVDNVKNIDELLLDLEKEIREQYKIKLSLKIKEMDEFNMTNILQEKPIEKESNTVKQKSTKSGDLVVDAKNINLINKFDFKDNYTYFEFRSEFVNCYFNSYSELIEAIGSKFMRVAAFVSEDKGFFIKKMANNLNFTESLGISDFAMFYDEVVGRTTRKVKIKFSEFLTSTKGFESMVCRMNPDYPISAKYFNTWKGFKASRVDLNHIDDDTKEGLELMKTFIMESWACNNETNYNYIISWFAGLFTNLDGINGIALAMVSLQGCGKNTLTNFIKLLLGYNLVFDGNGIEQIIQKHNDIIEGKRLNIINEMASTKEEFIKNFDNIKTFITEDQISIEPKGMKRKIVDNIGNYILFTNHRDSIIVSESDRRYAIFEMSDIHRSDSVYFGNLRKKCFNEKVANAFYTYLIEFKAVNILIIPSTSIRKELQELSKPNTVKFIDSFIEELENQSDDDDENLDEDGNRKVKIRKNDLYLQYRNWCQTNGERNIVSNTKFGTNIKQLKFVKETKTRGVNYYIISP